MCKNLRFIKLIMDLKKKKLGHSLGHYDLRLGPKVGGAHGARRAEFGVWKKKILFINQVGFGYK